MLGNIRSTPMKPIFLITTLIAAGAAGLSHAALYEAEPFGYPTGTGLDGLNGGTGWSSGWVDPDQDVTLGSGSLPYPASSGIPSSGNRISLTAATVDATAYRPLGTSMSLNTSGQVYYSSALFNVSAAAGESSLVSFTDTTTGTGNVRWQYGIDPAGKFYVTINAVNNSATSATTLVPGTTYLLVSMLRTNTGTSGADEYFLKIFAAGDTVAEPVDDAGWDLSGSDFSGVNLQSVRLNMTNAAGQTNQLDELLVGNTFADVVPEPSSSAMLMLPALCMLARRRR